MPILRTVRDVIAFLTVHTVSLFLCTAPLTVGAQVDEHESLTWNGPGTCVAECHESEALEVHGSVMYQWQGAAPDMVNGPGVQGKISGGVNSYCINILGNWNACGNCHVGLGARPQPEATPEQIDNIDCMVCHQQEYRRKRVDGVIVPDVDAMTISMDEAVQTVHLPVRFNCLQCHAKAGGGDAVKRGDLSLAHAGTSDRAFDVHMATSGGDLRCQECHHVSAHRFAGKGSDLRPTDSDLAMGCADCHSGDVAEHGNRLQMHMQRLACQMCHIPTYAKNASDSDATEATEVHRTWLDTHSTAPPYHPVMDKLNNLEPRYRFWNRKSDNYLLGDVAVVDPETGRYPTSRPLGDARDPEAKLFPFKYKTAQQPMVTSSGQLIALDTSVFFATGDADSATRAGLVNMGLPDGTAFSWVETDTFQLLNHEVGREDDALSCNECHGATRMDFQALGYAPWGEPATVCSQCHGPEEPMSFTELHDRHVAEEGFDCSWCHGFARPERNLTMPTWLFRDGFQSGDADAWSVVAH